MGRGEQMAIDRMIPARDGIDRLNEVLERTISDDGIELPFPLRAQMPVIPL